MLTNQKEMKDRIFINISNGGWKDATDEVSNFCVNDKIYYITFKTGKTYPFAIKNVQILFKAAKMEVDPFLLAKFTGGKESYLYETYGGNYILDMNLGVKKFSEDQVQGFVAFSNQHYSIFNYYSSLAKVYDKSTENDFLRKQYEEASEIWNANNVLSDLLCKKIYRTANKNFILPFSYNNSQIIAIKRGLESNISVIQGPPGTGKTQTILNLIANILINHQTVAVISNNNRAVLNVYEKLEEAGYGFLCANLGNLENRELFFSKEHSLPRLTVNKSEGNLEKLINQESIKFEYESKLNKLILEKENISIEYKKYKSIDKNEPIKIKKSLKSADILKLMIKLENRKKEKIGFFTRINLKSEYGIKLKISKKGAPYLSSSLQHNYVNSKMQEITREIDKINKYITNYNQNKIGKQIINISKYKFDDYLEKEMSNIVEKEYNTDNFKKEFSTFIQRYPIILSSTYCLPTTVPKRFTFDYIIIDESSQSTITTVLPSLTKGKRLIVIGDDKQLPPVIPENIELAEKEISSVNDIDTKMRDDGKSFLSFTQKYLGKLVNITLLREHYRCSKQIIGFSNARIYNNQLEIRKKDDDKEHLQIIKTAPGNHARKNDTGSSGQYNQREIDEIKKLINSCPKNQTIGVITPYRRQAELLRQVLPKEIEVGTIHTFQGREQQTIIFSTVANSADDYQKDEEIIKSFIDNEQLINVAITRAKENFILVTSDKIFHSNYGILSDLVKYICYQTNIKIVEGTVVSVFDILYDDYSNARKLIANEKEILTEVLIEDLIKEILKEKEYNSLSFSMHVNLKSIITINRDLYSEEEFRYLTHPWTHLDFVIFNKYDKIPILAIEVDGISYHEQNERQSNHDKIKDKCLGNSRLKLIRLKTNGANEKEKIVTALNDIIYQ